jgi:arginine decarboxylase
VQRARPRKKDKDQLSGWSFTDSIDLYGVERWSEGAFSIGNTGNVMLRGYGDNPDVDLKALVDEIRMRGLNPPVLMHFTDILHRRMDLMISAFAKASEECAYKGAYRGVYPIKVNQHRHVLEDIVQLGRPLHWGLECGSKPELVLAIALHDDAEGVIICNGYKDRDYIETALQARQLGNNIFLVVEKLSELELILDVAKQRHVEPLLGIRTKLASRGKGLWESSGGERSKFGLRSDEIVEAVKILKRRKMLGCLQLLHWHLGSQICDIQNIKASLKEGAGFFIELCRLGAPVRYIDVGGGLAVDYDGSHTNFESSANYTVGEYAADVVSIIGTACNEAGLPHPALITEAGRSLVAHHSVLVLEAMATDTPMRQMNAGEQPRKPPEAVKRLMEVKEDFVGKNFQETFHDALEARRELLTLFSLGQVSLTDRALGEAVFWGICDQILDYVRQLDYVPDEMEGLEKLLATTYYCNFSLFQSLPDHWAVNQLFPMMPLHRHLEQPTQRGILADITCDSDGTVKQFVDLRDVRETLPLHRIENGTPYYIGVFLVGAYQEILGDLHNLFGDTHAVHVSVDKNGYVIDKTVEGDSVGDVLEYVQFNRRDVLGRLRQRVESALRAGDMSLAAAAPFMREIEAGLDHYTYYRTDEPRQPKGQKARQ